MRALPALLLALAAACSEPTTTRIEDGIASVCQEEGTLFVRLTGCLSSSCDTVTASGCEAVLQGDALVVTASATVASSGNECTADCGLIDVTCPVPAGGDAATTITWDGGEAPFNEGCGGDGPG